MSSYVDTENLSYYDLDLWLNKALSGNNKNVKTEIPKGGIMRLDKWAVTAQEALQAALGIAADAQAGQLMPIHMLKALLSSGEHNLSAIIERVGANPRAIESQVDEAIERQPQSIRRTDGCKQRV